MNFALFFVLLLIVIEESTQKRHKRRVPVPTHSSDVQKANINCKDCRGNVTNSEGFITSVNNTSTQFYELIYGWTVEVPMYHDILLTFSWLNKELLRNETSSCQSCKPYFEIIYGYCSSESTFKIDKFYNIGQLTNLTIPSYKTEIRYFSGIQCNESQNFENVQFTIHFKAIPLDQTWSIYTILSVLIPAAFIFLGVAYFYVIIKKKEEINQDVLTLPIPIYVDLDDPSDEFKKCVVKGKEKRGHGLRLRTHHSSQLEEPKGITVISSLVESEVSDSSLHPEDLVTPDSSNLVPVAVEGTKKHFFKKKLPPKVNLLNRFQRSAASTPRYTSFNDETLKDDRLSKSDIVIFEKRKVSRDAAAKVFNFDVLPSNIDPSTQTELETSVFLHSSSGSSTEEVNEFTRELPFVSPKKN